MLHYKIYQNKSKGNKAYGKWFARAAVNQTIDLEQLAEHMANHNTPYSKGAIFGVLTDMVNCIRELVLEGNAVKIPNLAIFSAGLTTTAADDPNVFSPTKNIKSVRDLTRAVLTAAAKVTRADTYDPSANAIEDETGTETETPTDPDGKSVNP